MFKKSLAIVLLVFSFTAMAQEKITLLWGFNPASNQANEFRALAVEMNKMQSKYEFVYNTKPGAGGAIAAHYVQQHPQTTLVGGSSSFFIRSNFDRATGYNVNDFQPVFVQALGAPVVLASARYHSLSEFQITDSVSVSMSGFGSHSNLMSSILNETYINLTVVNYTDLIAANKDVMGRFVDAGWNWLSDADPIIESGALNALGITGTRNIKGYKTFASQGVKGFENVSMNTALFASTEMSAERVNEIYELLRVANRAPAVQALYAKEYSISPDFTQAQTRKWFAEQSKFWQEQSGKVKILHE